MTLHTYLTQNHAEVAASSVRKRFANKVASPHPETRLQGNTKQTLFGEHTSSIITDTTIRDRAPLPGTTTKAREANFYTYQWLPQIR